MYVGVCTLKHVPPHIQMHNTYTLIHTLICIQKHIHTFRFFLFAVCNADTRELHAVSARAQGAVHTQRAVRAAILYVCVCVCMCMCVCVCIHIIID
jgi:hypothetical protein